MPEQEYLGRFLATVDALNVDQRGRDAAANDIDLYDPTIHSSPSWPKTKVNPTPKARKGYRKTVRYFAKNKPVEKASRAVRGLRKFLFDGLNDKIVRRLARLFSETSEAEEKDIEKIQAVLRGPVSDFQKIDVAEPFRLEHPVKPPQHRG